jgi:hypothetical protein
MFSSYFHSINATSPDKIYIAKYLLVVLSQIHDTIVMPGRFEMIITFLLNDTMYYAFRIISMHMQREISVQ